MRLVPMELPPLIICQTNIAINDKTRQRRPELWYDDGRRECFHEICMENKEVYGEHHRRYRHDIVSADGGGGDISSSSSASINK